MKLGGILLSVALAVLLSWGHSYPISEDEEECRSAREHWTQAMSALKDYMDAYTRVKEESLEPRIREMMAAANKRTTVARIVRDVLKDHARRLGDARNDLLRVEKEEKAAFSDWRACVSRIPGRRRRADPASLRTARKYRDTVYKKCDLLLLDQAFMQYKDSRPRRPPDDYGYGYDRYWR